MNTPATIAREVMGFVQSAVGDIASDMLSPHSGFLDDQWKRRIAEAKRNGVSDVPGWLADELYNDPDTLSDLLGDRIHDAVRGNEAEYRRVLDELEKRAHPGLRKAVADLRRNGGGA
jgi:hypothetical protein